MKKLLLSIMLVLGIATSGWATTYDFSYYLTVPNSGLSVATGPYASIGINLNGTGTVATFDVLAEPGFSLVNGKMFDINTSAAATVSSIVETAQPGFNVETPTVTYNGNPHVSDFGKFNIWISNPTASNLISELTFSLNRTSGSWSSASDVLSVNGTGYFSAGHIAINNMFDTEGSRITGFAGNGEPPTVPEPGTLLLLGGGLFGLAVYGKRRMNRES